MKIFARGLPKVLMEWNGMHRLKKKQEKKKQNRFWYLVVECVA